MNKIENFEKIKEEVLKELENWHLKVYDISDETTIHNEWYIDRKQAVEVVRVSGWDEEHYKITLKKESELDNPKAIKLTQQKTAQAMIKEIEKNWCCDCPVCNGEAEDEECEEFLKFKKNWGVK